MAAFAGKHVFVAGGTGIVGSAVAKEVLQQGGKVTVSTRSQDSFNAFKGKLPAEVQGNVFGVVADIRTEEGVKKIFDETTKRAPVQHVVACIGSWWQGGKLVDQTLAEFNQGMLDRVTGHFLLFKTFIPYLDKQQGSTYTILTGDAGNDYVAPNISLICVTSGAMNGFSTAARAEHKDSQVAVSDFRIHIMVYPKPDSEFPSTETHTMGNDVIGKAIVNSIIKRSRDRIDVRVRKDAHELAK
ncbi:17-beta-hydroxysteroid dehydrogenase 14-like isoform X2 [Littorina saxatilis]|uniref:Uncharacterized protein n=1 Tax=Littorina saxatilis TaxID=31220 RepID=A0AAN9GDV6_9CAEN